MWRKILPFVAAVLAAFVITGLSQLTEWPSGVVYALIGFAAGALVFLGIPFAFNLFLIGRRNKVHADIAAVVAEERRRGIALAYNDALVTTKRLKQDELGGLRPFIVPAGRAVRVCPPGGKPPLQGVEIRHRGEHLKPNHVGSRIHTG